MNRAMRLAELLPDIDAVPPSLEVTGLVLDSREVERGNAFVAIAGEGGVDDGPYVLDARVQRRHQLRDARRGIVTVVLELHQRRDVRVQGP